MDNIGLDQRLGENLQNTEKGPERKPQQKLKVRTKDLEDLEKKDCEQQTVGEDDFSWQELAWKVEEAIQPGKDQLEDLGNNTTDSQEMVSPEDGPTTLEEEI